jgi:hypothetical protein
MRSIKYFLAVALIVFSSQSSALFMPADFQVNSGVEIESNDGGC